MLETLDLPLGSEDPRASIIWLHGLGADMHDFEPIVPELGIPASAGVRFVFPNAPPRPVTLNGGMVMRAWFDVITLDHEGTEDEDGIRESERLVREIIDREKALGVPPERIVLAGFSQGGAIALQTGLRYEESLAGILALSTWLPLHDRLAREEHAANRATPIFQAHGEFDPLVAIAYGRATSEYLRTLGHTVDFRSYPCQHAVCPEELRDVARWLRDRIGVEH